MTEAERSMIMTELLAIKGDVGELKGTAEATLEQAKKTNGRVTALEDDVAELQTRVAIDEHDEKRDNAEARDATTRRRDLLSVRTALGAAFLGGLAVELFAVVAKALHVG